MFAILLLVAFLISLAASTAVALIFRKSLAAILKRIIAEDLHKAWLRYITFAIFVVGVSSGTRLWDLQRYINPGSKGEPPLELTSDRWTLEAFQCVIGALQGCAWMLLLVFGIALIAVVIVRGQELRAATEGRRPAPSA